MQICECDELNNNKYIGVKIAKYCFGYKLTFTSNKKTKQ